VALVGGEPADLVDVGAHVGLDQPADVVIGDRLLPGQQRQARDEPLDVPGEVPDVRLVVVVDVEDEHAVVVHVGAEVLRVQVALDPHAGRALVGPRVGVVGAGGVEQAGTAAAGRGRVGGQL